jgi:YVTN family beta-propeller protein
MRVPVLSGGLDLVVAASLSALSACSTTTFVSTKPSTDRVAVALRPYGLAISANGIMYTSQLDGRSVTRLRVGAAATSGVVLVGETPTDVTFDPAGSLAFVTNQFDPSVGIIDVASGRQTQVIRALASTFRVLVAPDGRRADATESDGRLLDIDVPARTLVTTVPIPKVANGLAFGLRDTILYVTSMWGNVSVVNLQTNAVVRTWNLGGTLQDVVVSRDGNTLYIAHEDGKGTIDVVNASTGVATSHLTAGAGVFGLALAPSGGSLYATEPGAGQIVVLDLTTGQVSRTFTVGGIPRRLAFDRATGIAVASNEAGWIDYLP